MCIMLYVSIKKSIRFIQQMILYSLVLILYGCSAQQKTEKYHIKILNINSLNIIIPDMPLQSLDVFLIKNIINNIKQKVFINRAGKNIQVRLKVIEFKKPVKNSLPYFIKLEFSGFGSTKEYMITGIYDISKLNILDQSDTKEILIDIASYISDKMLSYLNHLCGFQHSDTFEDAFISYNESSYQSGSSQIGPVNNGLYVTWEHDQKYNNI